MTLEEWKADIESRHNGVTYRETGPYWRRLDWDDNGPKLTPTEGPHYIDAVPARGTTEHLFGRLLGTYDMTKGEGVFYGI